MMRSLVTGGAGFIGSHIAEALVKGGYAVRIFDNFSSGKAQNVATFVDDVELVTGDVRRPEEVEAAARGCDVIFHQAAIVSVPYSVEHPSETLATNIGGTLNVLEAARKARVRRVIFASSAAVYGEDPALPKSETMIPSPIAPYGIEKLTGEHYLRTYAKLHRLEAISLRYFNVFGPRQDPSSAYSGVISKFVDQAIAGHAPTIFGDGSASRDFVFVANVVDANLRALVSERADGEAYNVACGVATTLRELVAMLGRIVGRDIVPLHAAPRAGDIAASVADVSKARDAFGYEPRISVEAGLARLVEHVKKQQALSA